MIREQDTANCSARDNTKSIIPEKSPATVQITTADIAGVTYIVEHETSRTARETPLEKIRKLILRDAENLHKYNGRRA